MVILNGDYMTEKHTEKYIIAKATWDDINDDIKELIKSGVYTEEEALCEVIKIVKE